MADNLLYYGDNLDVLRRHVPAGSVDLVYLDPPFNSDQNYNVLFAAKDGHLAAGQIQAFEDTWHWDESAARQFQEIVERGDAVSDVLRAFRLFLGDNDMLAYLSMMAPRLVELRRVLKDGGSIYLHCDQTANAHLRILMDSIFGPECFQNEIIWSYRRWPSPSNHYQRMHDVLLFYAKAAAGPTTFNVEYEANSPSYIKRFKGKTQMLDPETKSRKITLEAESKGLPRRDVWEVSIIAGSAKERLGYPTQKPEALLERIIATSSEKGDMVLDPFCGCGTTVSVAQRLGRRWIGIDITHLAISLIKHRLETAFGAAATYRVVGEPTTVEDAKVLAESDPYQFQWWALGLVGARGVEKKGADKGIDGRLFWHEGDGKTRQLIISVKAGNLHRSQVHELGGVIQREKADIGVLLSFDEPTRPMREEAASAGIHASAWGKHARIQLLTVAELLDGKGIDYPRTAGTNVTLRAAPRATEPVGKVFELDFTAPPLRRVAEPEAQGYPRTPSKAKKPRKRP